MTTIFDDEGRYKLEVTPEQIDEACRIHNINHSIDNDDDPEMPKYREDARKLITWFAENYEIFYTDDADRFQEKNFKSGATHMWYDIMVKRGDFAIQTEIGLPRNAFANEPFQLSSVLQALAFELVDPAELDNAPEEGSFELAKYQINTNKMYDEFGMSFYVDILDGSV